MSDKKKTGADIPTLKKKEREKERKGGGFVAGQSSGGSGGALARWFGAGARPASLSKGALGVARVGAPGMKLGLLPQAINFFSSQFGIAVLTIGLTGGSVFTLFTLGGRKGEAPPKKTALFGARGASASSDAETGDPARPGSINYFTSANQGRAFQGEAPAGGSVDGAATAEDVEEAADAAAEADIGSGPDLAEELFENLEKPKMIASKGFGKGAAQALGSGVGLAGGSGMAGGVNRQFNQRPMKEGVLSKPAPAGRKLTARRTTQALRNVGGKGSMKQLRFANRRSVTATGRSSAEGQSFEAANAFDTAPAAAGSEIGGAGLGAGQGGAGASASSSVDDGGPLGTSGQKGEEDVKKVGQSKDKAPYTGMVMMAQAMLMAASTIIAIVGILSKLGEIPPLAELKGIAYGLYLTALGMAAAATAMGVIIMTQYGQQTQGMILTVGGGITTALGAIALMGDVGQSTAVWMSILGGVAGLAASVGSLLAPGSGFGFGGDAPGEGAPPRGEGTGKAK